ncbi:2-polyprenyl-3-methyl-6-methoxy-1,4-benzoquinone monooxygenase [Microbulbifer sp. THAF38]|uniref:2-polyprenyl-3-methyl-6-methoxy-1,4-benzoquinone monooxygenase n=1 Tax=Microbulbifer sp. THAF38 TaxID=2587856 RepID=UPI001268210A|nr:2-polyprenyl-3-methyl-6-methoxy-1,4-benzoquinone monooxygenase [Microbulbifer sp. THAF38]QFT53366.1 2-nonaprenyl-3-methyl-6-methoxy-1,4-benzoquinol hydroxylase [Microbulbifer sp. THAF38]
MSERNLSGLDRLLIQADRALRTLSPGEPCHGRASPAKGEAEAELSDAERKHAAGLMRVNHSGEVCAQALYQGQALTAKLPEVRGEMERAADEEIDHLAWCEQRLKELDSRPSLLNPLWYGLSFGLGAAAGKISDRISLGFVAATEERVCEHLESHLQKLPAQDKRSRAVVEQMLVDESEHAHAALAAGGKRFPAPVKGAMSLVSKVMTSASYKI